MKNQLKKLTLVVPTYERQEFALRSMRYWSDKSVSMIVLDGSVKPIDSVLLKEFGTQIRYLHKPIGFYERLCESLDLIDTEYAALAGDDEFYIPSAVEQCINELDNDPHLVACCGRAIGFTPYRGEIYGHEVYPLLAQYLISQSRPVDRCVFHMLNYVPSLVYAVCKSKFWKQAWSHTLRKEFPVFAIGELQFEMCLSYAGKSKVVPQLMWLRSNGETVPVRGTDPSFDPQNNLALWWLGDQHKASQTEFISIMSEAFLSLQSEDNNIKNCRDAVVASMEAHLSFVNNQNSKASRLRNSIAKRLPKNVKTVIKKILPINYISTKIKPLYLAAKELESESVHVDFAELSRIQSIVKNFHAKRT